MTVVGEFLEHHPDADKTALVIVNERHRSGEAYYLAELKFFFPSKGSFTLTLRKRSLSLDGARNHAVEVLQEIRQVGLADWLNADLEAGKGAD